MSKIPSLYVVMIELNNQKWFLRKMAGGKFTPTSQLTNAFCFKSIPNADKQKSFWDRKFPKTDTYRLIYDSEGKPKLYTLEGEPVEWAT
jgi:hypothetical protein